MPGGFNLKGCCSNKSPEPQVNQPTRRTMFVLHTLKTRILRRHAQVLGEVLFSGFRTS